MNNKTVQILKELTVSWYILGLKTQMVLKQHHEYCSGEVGAQDDSNPEGGFDFFCYGRIMVWELDETL